MIILQRSFYSKKYHRGLVVDNSTGTFCRNTVILTDKITLQIALL